MAGQNVYDDPEFFAAYQRMREAQAGINAAVEEPALSTASAGWSLAERWSTQPPTVWCSRDLWGAFGRRRRRPAQRCFESGRCWVLASCRHSISPAAASIQARRSMSACVIRSCRDFSGHHGLARPSSVMPGKCRTVAFRVPGPLPTASSMCFSALSCRLTRRTPPGHAQSRRMERAQCPRRSGRYPLDVLLCRC
jgi:hypothetical protein